jgi:UPF0176 protein
MSYCVILYYKYIDIVNPLEEQIKQKDLAISLNLVGRILIAEEGINGTLCGTDENCKKYIEYMDKSDLYKNIDFKISRSDFICFSKLIVKNKKEIVVLSIDPKKINAKNAAKTISSDELHEKLINKNENIVLFDTRNHYESRIGKFEGAITPDIKTSRDFEKYFNDNKDIFKDKEVVMYCTGGVRCERISILLENTGVAKSVSHLKNGICNYTEKYPDGFFRGRNYVFDDRISIKINDTVLTNCDVCNIKCDIYNNCLNAICNKHYICCDDCIEKLNGCCSERCFRLTKNKMVQIRPPLPSRKEKIKVNEI